MLVSIITPTYNSLKFIDETIKSIIDQTYSNWELVITDDCSSDGTWEYLKTLPKKDDRIKVYRLEKNSGAGIARNNSIMHAIGRYIAFCDSDDKWLPEKLEKQLKFMDSNNLAFTYSSYQKINELGLERGVVHVPKELTYKMLLKTCPIGCLTAIYDSQIIGKVYMPEIRKRQDYGLWLLIMQKIKQTKGMTEVLALYRERSNSISSNKFKAALYHYKVLRKVGNVSTIKAWYYFSFYAFLGLQKYLK
ncbi:glycosyltransferase [Bacteroidales bacterium 6E]|nr:glycosyltransferase [Bacteroidales bacterium 6E]